MYKDKFKQWKLNKYNREHEMYAIARKLVELDAAGQASVFWVRGRQVTEPEVTRYFRRKGYGSLREVVGLAASSVPATPSDVVCTTPYAVDPFQLSRQEPSPLPVRAIDNDNTDVFDAAELSLTYPQDLDDVAIDPISEDLWGDVVQLESQESPPIVQENPRDRMLSPPPVVVRPDDHEIFQVVAKGPLERLIHMCASGAASVTDRNIRGQSLLRVSLQVCRKPGQLEKS